MAGVPNHVPALCARGEDEEDRPPASSQWEADLHRPGDKDGDDADDDGDYDDNDVDSPPASTHTQWEADLYRSGEHSADPFAFLLGGIVPFKTILIALSSYHN